MVFFHSLLVPELQEWNYPFPFPFPNSQMSFPLTPEPEVASWPIFLYAFGLWGISRLLVSLDFSLMIWWPPSQVPHRDCLHQIRLSQKWQLGTWQMLDMSKLLHGFLFSCYTTLSKLPHRDCLHQDWARGSSLEADVLRNSVDNWKPL